MHDSALSRSLLRDGFLDKRGSFGHSLCALFGYLILLLLKGVHCGIIYKKSIYIAEGASAVEDSMKFLVIEDNINLNQSIRDCLSKLGTSDAAYDGLEGLYMAESNTYDLIILDLLLPKKNGFDVLQDLRKKSTCPVIILTALSSTDKKIEGLKLGADDYLPKPFDRDELVARAEAVLRRYNNNFHTKYTYDNIELDFANKMFKVNGEYVKLAGKMYDIVEYLIRNRNIIIPKEQLFNRIWGFDSDTVITVIEVYVSNLRKILEKYGCKDYLKTIKNIGYMWREKVED